MSVLNAEKRGLMIQVIKRLIYWFKHWNDDTIQHGGRY